MTRYLGYSALLHLFAFGGFLFVLLHSAKPPVYYGFEFTGGQSGFGSGKLEPAPMTEPREARKWLEGASPETMPGPSDSELKPSEDAARVAVGGKKSKAPDKKKAAGKKIEHGKKKMTADEGRGDSPLGRGDAGGAKEGPVGGVGTSLDIGGFGPGSAGASDARFPFQWYSKLIYTKLWQTWDRTDVSNQSCRITFLINKDGTVKKVEVEESSGDAFFDLTAKRAVTGAAPFPPLPAGYEEENLPVAVRFRLQ